MHVTRMFLQLNKNRHLPFSLEGSYGPVLCDHPVLDEKFGFLLNLDLTGKFSDIDSNITTQSCQGQRPEHICALTRLCLIESNGGGVILAYSRFLFPQLA